MDSAEPFFALDSVELDIGFGTPQRQARWSIALRGLLVVPHLVALVVLTFAGTVLAFIGWFAALALGRLPRWIADCELSVVTYSVRVNAYAFLLADEYPPFSFWAPDYPIVVQIGASRLSRLRVFFRWLLAIPVGLVSSIAWNGLLVLSPVIWLATLIFGRTPQPLFSAAAAVIRYQARYQAYMSLVTDTYPRRLFGDADSDWTPEGFRVPRSGGADSIMGVIIVLGIAATVASMVLRYELTQPPPRNPAVVAAEGRLDRAIDHSFAFAGCNLGCEQGHERALGEALQRFATDLLPIPFPVSQHRRVAMLIVEVRATGQVLIAASKSKDGGRAQGINPADPADSVGFVLDKIARVLGPGPSDYPYGGYIG